MSSNNTRSGSMKLNKSKSKRKRNVNRSKVTIISKVKPVVEVIIEKNLG